MTESFRVTFRVYLTVRSRPESSLSSILCINVTLFVSKMISTRFVILILLLAVASKTSLIPYFLPYGSAVWIPRGDYTVFGKVDPTNVSLRLSSKFSTVQFSNLLV